MQAAAGVFKRVSLYEVWCVQMHACSMVCANVCMKHGVCKCMHVAWCVQASSMVGSPYYLVESLAYSTIGSSCVLRCKPLILCRVALCFASLSVRQCDVSLELASLVVQLNQATGMQ